MLYNLLCFNWFSRPIAVILGFVLMVLLLLQAKPPLSANKNYAFVKIDLSQYHLTSPSITIADINDNASGLTYNTDSKTLFMVVNRPAKILELDTQGRTKRQILLSGFTDTEGIIYLGDNNFAVTEERDRKLTFITINETTKSIQHKDALSFQFPKGRKNNKGFEGLTYDFRYNFFYIANEKQPRQIIALPDPRRSSIRLNHQILRAIGQQIDGLNDLAGLHLDNNTGNLLVLSEESKLIIETNLNGQRISHLKLTSNQSGLPYDIPQPEGITMDAQGRLYICSEPNLLYIFDKKDTDKSTAYSNTTNKDKMSDNLLTSNL